MRLDTKNERFLEMHLTRLRTALASRGVANVDGSWDLERRLSAVLAAQAFESIASWFGLAQANDFDTPIEVLVDGRSVATHEAEQLQNDLWLTLLNSIHSVIEDRGICEAIMSRERIGPDTLPRLRFPEGDPDPEISAEIVSDGDSPVGSN